MVKPSADQPLGIVRSAAVISLGLVALAGSVAVSLCRRLTTAPTRSTPAAPQVSRLAVDEWSADLARLKLPSRDEVAAMQRQLTELETQIDQIIQRASKPNAGE